MDLPGGSSTLLTYVGINWKVLNTERTNMSIFVSGYSLGIRNIPTNSENPERQIPMINRINSISTVFAFGMKSHRMHVAIRMCP